MENNLIDYVSQLMVRKAAKSFYSISRRSPKKEVEDKLFDKIVDFISSIPLPDPKPPKTIKTGLSMSEIEKIVCNYYEISPVKLHEKNRHKEIAQCRFMTCYFIYKYRVCGIIGIANYYDLNHSSIIHAKRRIKELSEIDERIKFDMDNIDQNIRASIKIDSYVLGQSPADPS